MKKYLICGLPFLAFILGAADFINFKPNFSDIDWNNVLIPDGQVTAREGRLFLAPAASVSTQRLPLEPGVLRINGSASGSMQLRLVFLRGGNHRDPGTEIGAKEFTSGQAETFALEFITSEAPKGCDGFRLEIANRSDDQLILNSLALKITVPGIQVNGDPLFGSSELNRDNWMVEHGKDWDNFNLSKDEKSIRVVNSAGPGGGNLLAITDTGSVKTPNFPYNGERVIIGAWVKQTDIRRAPNMPSWACASIQVIQFDKTGKTIGHVDMTPLCEGSTPWQFYSMVIEPGYWSHNTDSFALFPRVFYDATGTLEVTAVSVIRQDSSFNPLPYDTEAGTVSVKTDQAGDMINPVWQSVDMSYIVDIEQPVMRQALAETRKAGARHLRLREFMQGMRILKELRADGSFELDFSMLDKNIDYVVKELGYILTVTVETTPNQLSSKPDNHLFANIHPPRDPDIWGGIVKEVILHWIERYGHDTVSQWTFECWNEPDAPCFFAGTEEEFANIFGAYLKALSEVKSETGVNFNISTMSAANPSPWFFSCFEKAESLGKLKEINSISFHIYAGFLNSMNNYISSISRMRRIAADYPPMAERPLYITEYNANSMSDMKLDTAAAAAFNVKAIRIFLDENIARAYYFCVCDYLWHSSQETHFDGSFGYFTKTGIPKPVFNSLILLNRFENCRRLPLESSNDPFDGIAGIDADGRTVKVLISTFDESQPDAAAPAKLQLALDWENRDSNINISMTRVNNSQANSYQAYLKAGKPTKTQQPDINFFREANQLKTEKATEFHIVENKLIIELEIELNSLCYLEIAPE